MVEQAEILEDDADAPTKPGELFLGQRAASWPKMWIVPRVGRSDSSINRNNVVLPAPDGPVRN